MSEDTTSNEETLADLTNTDIRTNIYEGGFKTWECSVDLASLLLDRGPRKDIDELVRCDQIIEVSYYFFLSPSSHLYQDDYINGKPQLGAGTALPTLTLFQHCLHSSIPLTFTLADFNASVLSLVTLPNILLTWALHSSPPHLPLPITSPTTPTDTDGDLEITPALISAFLSDLVSKQIQLNFISGPWSSALASLIPPSAPEMGTLVLAAETIYSPASTEAFVAILLELLKRVKMAKAVVGAKRVYFGVGGSVGGFKERCAEGGAVAYEVENSGVEGLDSGVGRALIEVQMF